MALQLPPSVSVNRFIGGFKSISDYTDLSDTETSDAENVLYSPKGDIDSRFGSEKLLRTRLQSFSATGNTMEPIKGIYNFRRLGTSSTFTVVACGDSVFNYSSATAINILAHLNSATDTFFSFTQIQDPDLASRDLAVISNGIDPITIWVGSGTATHLSSVTGSSGIPRAKYISVHKNRLYAANILDTAEIDSPVKVAVSGFGADGRPDPHIMGDSFFLGGSSQDGQIQGMGPLNNQMIFYTERSVWKFSPGAGNNLDTGSLQQLQRNIGLLAPRSLVDVGGAHIFLSENGVYIFDGNQFIHLSEKVDDEFLINSNRLFLKNSVGAYDKQKNQYVLYFPYGESTKNNRALVYDMRPGMKIWQPPITNREVSSLSTFINKRDNDTIIYGDYSGFLFEDGKGSADGISQGINGSPTSATSQTLVFSATAGNPTFPTATNQLAGLTVSVIGGTGDNQTRKILTSDSQTITLESPWSVTPDTSSTITIGGYNKYWRSKDYDLGGHDIVKIFRHVRLRLREEGSFNLGVHYIVDFKNLTQATLKNVSLNKGSWTWGTSLWGTGVWGRISTFINKISLRNTSTQRLQGNHFALRFSNKRANEPFRVTGFDIELKSIGKR